MNHNNNDNDNDNNKNNDDDNINRGRGVVQVHSFHLHKTYILRKFGLVTIRFHKSYVEFDLLLICIIWFLFLNVKSREIKTII